MKLAERLIRYRYENNLSTRALANKAQMSYAFLNAIERGKKKPGVEASARLANLLGVPIEQLDNGDKYVVQIAMTSTGISSAGPLFAIAKLYSDGTVHVGQYEAGQGVI